MCHLEELDAFRGVSPLGDAIIPKGGLRQAQTFLFWSHVLPIM